MNAADDFADMIDAVRAGAMARGVLCLSITEDDRAWADDLLMALQLSPEVLVVVTMTAEGRPGDPDFDTVARNRAQRAEQERRQAAEDAARSAQAAQDAARAVEVAAAASVRPASATPLPEAPNVIQLGRPKPKQPPGIRFTDSGPVWVSE